MPAKKKNSKEKKSDKKDITKKAPAKKEKVCEVFEVEKDGKEKTITACGEEEVKHLPKDKLEYQNRIIKNVLIWIGIVAVIIVLAFLYAGSLNHFVYKGVSFDIVKYCDSNPCLVTYKTSLPVLYNGSVVPYNFYLRNDPRGLDVPFYGNVSLRQNMVINMTDDFNCDGDGSIAIANMLNLYKVIGINAIKDENATCDPNGKYTFLQIQKGNETQIKQTGVSCYEIDVSNCEILKSTEKFMIEIFTEIHKNSQQN